MPCDKKPYFNERDAEQFAERLKKDYPEQVEQFPYLCEECGHYHLSTIPPEAHGLAQVHFPSIPEQTTGRCTTGRGRNGETTERVRQLLSEGKSRSEMARTLNTTVGNITYHERKIAETLSQSISVSSSSIDDLTSRQEQLRAELERIEKQKQALIEAKRLKIEATDRGFIFRKEGNVLSLSFDDTSVLILETIPHLPNSLAFITRVYDLGAEIELKNNNQAA